MTPLQRLFHRLLPGSIVARMTVILFLGILIAQGLWIWIWGQQLRNEERLRISEIAVNMGARMGQTIQFFSRLPREYRHVVLDQLRDMGGTRFFVSVNELKIDHHCPRNTHHYKRTKYDLSCGQVTIWISVTTPY